MVVHCSDSWRRYSSVVRWRLIGQLLHLAVQVHATDAHLLCNQVHTQVGIVDVFVDYLHHPLHQGIVWCLHFYLLYLVILAFIARELVAQSAAVLWEPAARFRLCSTTSACSA